MGGERNRKKPDWEDVFFFEIELQEMGLLSEYEKAGILPIPKNLNPFDPETEEEQFNQWVDGHPEESRNFSEDCERREQVITRLLQQRRHG